MATLADELLNDFESDEGEEAQDEREFLADDGVTTLAGKEEINGAMVFDGDEEQDEEQDEEDEEAAYRETAARPAEALEDAEEARARVDKMQLASVSDVRSVAGLMKTLQPVVEVSSSLPISHNQSTWFTTCSSTALTLDALQKISHYRNLPPDRQTRNTGSIEDNPEYRLLTQANTMSTQIDSEIILVHKFIRDHYSVCFPELETLVSNPLLYARAVATIGNGPMENIAELSSPIVGKPLRQVLDGPTFMTVSVEATVTKGQPLPDSELQNVLRACEMTLQLDKARDILTDYVQSRMTLFAPNLTILVGSLTAAQLINFAGGLTGLAKTPACNLAPLGSKKQAQAGFATNVGLRHQGFLYYSPILQSVPNDLKKQALRIVSAKVVLAARVDQSHSSPNGSTGEELKSQCLDRLDKLTEPPPNKGVRALPAPDDKPSRKRGGRRARKAKEATAMTDLRKAQNRMAFGREEAEVGYGTGEGTKGLGMIGQQDTGRIRAQQIDKRTAAKLSKKNPGWGGTSTVGGMSSSLRGFGQGGAASVLKGHGLRTSGVGGGGGAAGTASTIAFTPVQGLELVDPKVRDEMNRKRKADEDRWFKGGTFTQVGGGMSMMPPPPKPEAAFKVPALPAKKKIDTGEGKAV